MDPLSHALVGAALGSLAATEPSAAMTVATVAGAVLPDGDIVIRMVAGRRAYMEWHRSVTHSALAAVPFALAIGWAVSAMFSDASMWQAGAWTLVGFISHVFLDLTNAYGTEALWPWSRRRFAWDWTSIVDFPILLLAVAGWAAPHWWPAGGRWVTAVTLLLMGAYLAMRATIHRRLLSAVISRYGRDPKQQVSVLPELLGWNRWRYLIDDGGDDLLVGEATNRPLNVTSPRRLRRLSDQVVAASLMAPATQTLQRFARHPVAEWRKAGDLYRVAWYDARFLYRAYAPFAAVVTLNQQLELVDDRLGPTLVSETPAKLTPVK